MEIKYSFTIFFMLTLTSYCFCQRDNEVNIDINSRISEIDGKNYALFNIKYTNKSSRKIALWSQGWQFEKAIRTVKNDSIVGSYFRISEIANCIFLVKSNMKGFSVNGNFNSIVQPKDSTTYYLKELKPNQFFETDIMCSDTSIINMIRSDSSIYCVVYYSFIPLFKNVMDQKFFITNNRMFMLIDKVSNSSRETSKIINIRMEGSQYYPAREIDKVMDQFITDRKFIKIRKL